MISLRYRGAAGQESSGRKNGRKRGDTGIFMVDPYGVSLITAAAVFETAPATAPTPADWAVIGLDADTSCSLKSSVREPSGCFVACTDTAPTSRLDLIVASQHTMAPVTGSVP